MANSFLFWLSILFQLGAAAGAVYLARGAPKRFTYGCVAAIVLLAASAGANRVMSNAGAGGAVLEASSIEWIVLALSSLLLAGICVAIRAQRVVLMGVSANEQTEQGFASVFEAAADAMILADANGTICLINPQTEKLFGYARSELIGKPVEILLPESIREAHRRRRETYLKNPVVRAMGGNIDLMGRRKDGSDVPVEISLGPVGEGAKLRVVASIRDMSAHKFAEQKLRESERAMATLLGNLPGMAFRCRGLPGRTMEFVSQGCLGLTGYSPDDLIGDRRLAYGDLIDPGDRAMVASAVSQCVGEQSPLSISYRIRTFSGMEKWVAERTSPIFSESGEFVSLEGLVTDITPQKHAEQSLRRAHAELEMRIQKRTAELVGLNRKLEEEGAGRAQADDARRVSEHRLQAILDNTTAVIFMKNRNGAYLMVNRRFEELFGVNRGQVVGLTDHQLFPAEYADALRANDLDVLNRGKAIEFEERVPLTGKAGSDGTAPGDGELTYLSLKFPLGGDGKEPDALCGISTDITDRIQVARELARAKESADAANRAKSEFLATMSHELRTPLNGLIGMMEVLLRTDLDVKQRRYAWMAKSSGDNLLALINDILDFSKVEAGRLDLESICFDLHYTAENVAVSLASRAENGGLELICGVHPSVPRMVRGDPGRLQQILINLITNAIKFTERGQVVIRAMVDRDERDQVLVRFTVSDTGIGIPESRKHRLFQSFSQMDSSTTRKYGGTGLGLAICKRLVELMGGQIGVESEEARGSTFWFVVPLERENAGSEWDHHALNDIRTLRVLCLDDNPVNLELLSEYLKTWDIAHEVVSSGEEGLELLRAAAARQEPFDVVLLDMQMPGMDGLAVGSRIRKEPQLEDTVLILLTSFHPFEDEAEMSELGFAGWLPKPIRASQLLTTIAESVTCAKAGVVRPEEAIDHARRLMTDVPRKGRSSGARVLVAEDDNISREIAKILLQDAGYDCHVVCNGAEAVEAVRRERFDIVFMDCQMPKMDGFEATRQIREWESQRKSDHLHYFTPIVALTANALQGDRERCLSAGMDDYITKPLEPGRLIQIVEANLRLDDSNPGNPPRPKPDIKRPSAASPPGTSRTDLTPPGTICRPGPASPVAAPIDVDALLYRWEKNFELATSILEKFRQQAPERVSELAECIANDRFEDASRIAHSLKGVAAYVSAGHVRSTAAELENLAHEADRGKAEECLLRLRAEVNRTLEYLPTALTMVANEAADAQTQRQR